MDFLLHTMISTIILQQHSHRVNWGKLLASLNDIKPGESAYDYESDAPPTETIVRCCQFPVRTNK